jgi:predicted short-subunit dehydrogenase-like oxidoreductase (DUF2520 family)
MFTAVRVIGAGRAGSAIAGRLRERGLLADELADTPVAAAASLVLLCVPDDQIAGVAARLPEGAWVAHVSGATPLTALDPHRQRFGVHPLQTLVRSRGPEQLDGAWGAVTAETTEARVRGAWLARTLGLVPFDLPEQHRALYHAGAAMASNYLVTLHRAASSLLWAAGAPPEALVPLMARTIENGFELTGPISRGDQGTVERHRAALSAHAPALLPLYDALAEATRA